MDFQKLTISADSLLHAISSADLGASEGEIGVHYVLGFGKRVGAEGADDNANRFLALLCGWRLCPDPGQAPLLAVWKDSGPGDVTESQLDVLASIFTEVKDLELRARLCDLLWIRRRDHVAATAACSAYLDSVERLVNRKEILGVKERLARAMSLANSLGRANDIRKEVERRLMVLAQTPNLENCPLVYSLETLRDARAGDATILYELARGRAESIAKSTPSDGLAKHSWARRYWELAAVFAAVKKDEPASRCAAIEAAKSFEREAEEAKMQSVAAHFWELALRAYRKIAGTESDRERVHQALLAAQSHIPKEMISSVIPMDLTELATRSQGRIRGKAKQRAIAEFVLASEGLPNVQARRQAEESIRSYPIQNLFGSQRFGGTGKVAATAPPAGFDEIDEKRLHVETVQQYRYFIPVVASGVIEPMRHELLTAHNIALSDVAEFVHNSPLVPVGREAFFTIGIYAGFYGRFIEAIHVLIPQVEHLLRSLLIMRGVTVSSINDEGIQEEFELNRILSMSQTQALLGEDLQFMLRVLLTERYGYNLRNEMAHGMAAPQTFLNDEGIYTWWYIFRLIARPVAEAIVGAEAQRSEQLRPDEQESEVESDRSD